VTLKKCGGKALKKLRRGAERVKGEPQENQGRDEIAKEERRG